MANSPLVSYTRLSPNHPAEGLMQLIALPLTQLSVSSVLYASAIALRIEADRQAATTASGLTAESVSVSKSRTAPGAHHLETTTSEP